MENHRIPCLIGLDWGTSSFRGWLLDADGKVLDLFHEDLGILKVLNNDFEGVYHHHLDPWFEIHGRLPVIASGMIGSRQGWLEAPYVSCPSGPEEIAEQMAYVPSEEKNCSPLMAIVPGMNHWNQGVPDVMRGEETQVFGAMGDENQHVIYILPGTHSKWVLTREGCIEDFVTFMSGELFSVLKEHSILGKLMQGDSSHQESFDRGCLQAFESPFGLLSQLFSARTMGLFKQVEEQGIHSFLSGLILGSELKEAISRFSLYGKKDLPSLILIGDGILTEAYKCAFDQVGHSCQMVSGNPATIGLTKMARLASLID